jgi:hypothetical protein
MMPNIHSDEQLMLARIRGQKSGIVQRQPQTTMRGPRRSIAQHLIGGLGTFFVRLGTHLKQIG